MSELCPDCGRPKATRMPDAISPKGPCARNFHPVGADDCVALTLERLRRELASAREIGEQRHRIVEGYAAQNDELEFEARRGGAFDAAVCYQQFATWLRSGQACSRICGTECRMVIGTTSNNLVVLRGDIADDKVTYEVGVASLRLSDALLAARAATGEAKGG